MAGLTKTIVAKRPQKSSASRKLHKNIKNETQKQIKKAHRWRPGTVALREVRKYQKSTNLLIAKAPFRRLVKEVSMNFKTSMRVSAGALEALQESTENYLTSILSDAYLCTVHARRVTLFPKDLQLALRLRGETRALPV
ncbi:histone H3 [Angomonas deanei]|uniref:Core histone H2A/H2B/H3/H4/Histone-like transcription factor (CBF/NF-Y) and archaeal histone, putative n=1 Tax=Angomonas deanei TaxID=59799 RepID=A0A7G2CG87_9TRYP|nr:histone H3 [Angomonas deanei]CAD2218840.1 Core histone H2A/H2B/H3/H4/Histone-like transcription factor (CBF/NF-Y) and archaeal histone, putative [Angomonas deanei]|eukprot:EPY41188.1 histone H3 [Angomonas deanei]